MNLADPRGSSDCAAASRDEGSGGYNRAFLIVTPHVFVCVCVIPFLWN